MDAEARQSFDLSQGQSTAAARAVWLIPTRRRKNASGAPPQSAWALEALWPDFRLVRLMPDARGSPTSASEQPLQMGARVGRRRPRALFATPFAKGKSPRGGQRRFFTISSRPEK